MTDSTLRQCLAGLRPCLVGLVIGGSGLLLGISTGLAAVPVLDHFHPAAAQTGTTNLITAIGKFDPWPPKVWVDDPAVRFLATTNKGVFSVELDATAAPGPRTVRFYNDDGASRPRCFVVDLETQTREVEPNDEFAAPQTLESLPAIVNGRLDKSGDVDSFGVALAAGQTLVAALDAYVLESPLDAVLRVTDARGVQLAWNHDGRTLDPFLAFTAPDAGQYVVQVMGFPHPATSEIRFHGGEKCIYRLRLNSGPYVTRTLPLGACRTGRTRLRLAGWNFPESLPREFDFDVAPDVSDSKQAPLRLSGVENVVRVPLGDGAEGLEQEPNDHRGEANLLELPGAVTGCLDRGGDEDRFRFIARKGERLQWAVQSVALGFPVDAWLMIENTNGTRLARNEGGNGRDPELTWTPDADGTFQVVVGSLVHRGGSNHWYRLSAARSRPDLSVSVGEQAFVFKPDTTNDLKVTVSRLGGLTNHLTVQAEGLPEGVSAVPVTVPDKGGDVTLKAIVSTNAPAFNGPFRIVVSSEAVNDTNGAPVFKRTAAFSFVSTSENNGVPQGYRELLLPSTDQLWLTVKAAVKSPESSTEAK